MAVSRSRSCRDTAGGVRCSSLAALETLAFASQAIAAPVAIDPGNFGADAHGEAHALARQIEAATEPAIEGADVAVVHGAAVLGHHQNGETRAGEAVSSH